MHRCFLLSLALTLSGSMAHAQVSPPPSPESDSLVIEHEGGRRVLRAANLAALPRQSMRATIHGGPEHEFSGPSIAAVLARAGVPLGGRGRALSRYLLVMAADGYRTVLSAGELDSTLTGRVPLLVDRQDGKPLASTEGPWRLLVPGDRRPARWVRKVTAFRFETPAP